MDAHDPQIDPKNRPSYRQHKQQRFWQILLPMMAAVLLIVVVFALVILTASRGDANGQVSIWADTSAILVLLPVILFAVGIAVLLFGLVYLLAKALKGLPRYTAIAQAFMGTVAEKVRAVSDAIASPFIAIRGYRAAMRRMFTGIGKIFHR